MPTYEYKCEKCNRKFDLFQNMSAEPIKACPECGGKVKRLIGTGSGPIFKGSGFYQTDYKNNKQSSSEKNKSTSIPKSNQSDTEKTASKTDKEEKKTAS